MKTPPLLLGAALLFWGWQTDHCHRRRGHGGGARGRAVDQSTLGVHGRGFPPYLDLLRAAAVGRGPVRFTASDGPAGVRGFLQNPNLATERNAGNASARTVAALIRWLPMIFFLFVAAQAFSSREGVPPETISVILRLRWQRARKLGRPLPAVRSVNMSYPYFVLCLLAASFHSSEDETFFWGLCALLAWALWSHRSRRYGVAIWASALAAAMVLGYSGQRGVGRIVPADRQLQRAVVLPRRSGAARIRCRAGRRWARLAG